MRAADLIHEDDIEAEKLLCNALTADIYHGPAHNNLGVIYLKHNKYYEAAHEFEWARKLMPGHPDPRMNLALTLERVGRIDEAMTEYLTALEVYPMHIPTLQGLARLQIKHNRVNESTREYLADIVMRGETEEWQNWARIQLLKDSK